MGIWDSLGQWVVEVGERYGVDPLVFALLYFGTIPVSLFSFWFLFRNKKRGRSVFLPVMGMFGSYIGTYVYMLFSGRNIPLWVWAVVLCMAVYSGIHLHKKLRARIAARSSPPPID